MDGRGVGVGVGGGVGVDHEVKMGEVEVGVAGVGVGGGGIEDGEMKGMGAWRISKLKNWLRWSLEDMIGNGTIIPFIILIHPRNVIHVDTHQNLNKEQLPHPNPNAPTIPPKSQQ